MFGIITVNLQSSVAAPAVVVVLVVQRSPIVTVPSSLFFVHDPPALTMVSLLSLMSSFPAIAPDRIVFFCGLPGLACWSAAKSAVPPAANI